MNRAPYKRTMGKAIFELNGIQKIFQGNGAAITALQNVCLTVDHGEMVAVMGPSGSGKSTLLFVLGLLLAPTKGRYQMLGRDMLALRRNTQAEMRRTFIGFVFQGSDMVEACNVYENLELPLIYANVNPKERLHRIHKALKKVDMIHRLHHPANQLSGGEQQRVGIARAMINGPRLILADEPTGQLDRANGQHVMDCFEQIASEDKTAVIIATHDPLVAGRCSRICHLEDGVLHEL